MDNPSPLLALACAISAVIVDPETPKPLLDSLVLWFTQLRDTLPIEKSLQVYAAEAEAVITAFASARPPQLRQSPPGEILHDGHGGTSVERATPLDNQQ